MIRGTTPTHTFTLPIDAGVIKSVKITYTQFGKVVLTKTGSDIALSKNIITVRLTQQDTFRFDCSGDVFIQLRILTTDGGALASKIMRVSVDRCLDDEVLA